MDIATNFVGFFSVFLLFLFLFGFFPSSIIFFSTFLTVAGEFPWLDVLPGETSRSGPLFSLSAMSANGWGAAESLLF